MPSKPKYKMLSAAGPVSMSPCLKTAKEEMRIMERELERSRVAAVQKELHGCMLKIHTESKKQKILQELIGRLKGDIVLMATRRKQDEEETALAQQKKIRKVEYDIEQILQKYNEQVAKINLLKESANSARSERVVYSELFKKLEREIKHYEELYKEQLIKARTTNYYANAAPLSSSSPPHKLSFRNSQHFLLNETAAEQASELHELSFEPNEPISSTNVLLLHHSEPKGGNILVTEPPIQDHSGAGLGRSGQKAATVHSVNSATNAKTLMASIAKYETFLERALVHCQMESTTELFEKFSRLPEENEQLLESIEALNMQIWDAEVELATLSHASKHQVANTPSESSSEAQELKLEAERRSESEERAKELAVVAQLADLLNVAKEELDDTLANIDWKVDNVFASEKPRKRDEESVHISSEAPVEVLLDRMDKFQESERILDRGTFKKEYYKELNKGKKHSRPRKTDV